MEYTKELIFPMYVGKCKVKVGDIILKLNGVVYDEYCWVKLLNGKSYLIYDCTLLLKPLSKMSDEHINIICDKLQISAVLLSRIFVNSDRVAMFWDEWVWLERFLVEHGYAFDDKLFKSGIAVEV